MVLGRTTNWRPGQRPISPVQHSARSFKSRKRRQVQQRSFVDSFTGQWEGQSAVFSSDGLPEPLPDHLVPPALKEWDMIPYDWQTRSLSFAEGDTVSVRAVRLTPTVGCEAEEKAGEATSSHQLHVSNDDGSCIGTHSAKGELQSIQISFSLSANTRLRLIVSLQPGLGRPPAGLGISLMELHREQKYSSGDQPFRPLQAEGTVKAFALKERLDLINLNGDWAADTQHWQATARNSPIASGCASLKLVMLAGTFLLHAAVRMIARLSDNFFLSQGTLGEL